MTIATQGNTPAQDELLPSVEQTVIKSIEEEIPESERAPEVDVPAPAPKKDEEAPADPRAARLERLAEQAHQNRADEAQAVSEVMVQTTAQPVAEPAPAPERMMKIKVRGEIVELPESEVIARAQKVDAADQYLSEAKDLLREAKDTSRQPNPQPTAQPAPSANQAEKADAIAKAIEIIQTGGDPAEAKALLETELNDRASRAAEHVIDTRASSQRSATYDGDVNAGFTEAATEYADLMANPVGFNTVKSLSGALQAHAIAEYLPTLAPEVQQAFSAAGITPDVLKDGRTYTPDAAAALYKDMLLKGYRLPRPSEVIKVAAKVVSEQMSGTTRPAAPTAEPAPQPALDRTARKEAISQPERTAIPKATVRVPQPRSEPQRAASARQELRASRRRGSA